MVVVTVLPETVGAVVQSVQVIPFNEYATKYSGDPVSPPKLEVSGVFHVRTAEVEPPWAFTPTGAVGTA